MIRYLWPLRLACRLVREADELRAKLAEQTAETWRMRADRDHWLNAWGRAGDEHTQAVLERDNLRDELAGAEEQRDRWEHGARSNFAALTDARGRVAVLEGQQAALVDGHAREMALRLAAERHVADARDEADTLENLCHMAERERDAAREQGAAEAFALRQELAACRVDAAQAVAWARAEAERLSAELRRVDPDGKLRAAVPCPCGCVPCRAGRHTGCETRLFCPVAP